MQLAINYSPAAARLVKTGKIDVDYFKTPNWEWMVLEASVLRPVAVHFTLEAGNAALGDEDWTSAEHLLNSTSTPYINLHLDCQSEFHPGVPINTIDPADARRLLPIMLSDVRQVTNSFGPGRVIIENSPYRGTAGKTLRPCVEPDLITRVVEETGCGLLLDIAHAFITSHYLGMDSQEYFSRLPVHQIKEMHFAGIHNVDGLLTDHLSILPEDWTRLDWVLKHIQSGEWSQPWLLAFEYGGVGEGFTWRSDPVVIADQVPRLMEKLAGFNS